MAATERVDSSTAEFQWFHYFNYSSIPLVLYASVYLNLYFYITVHCHMTHRSQHKMLHMAVASPYPHVPASSSQSIQDRKLYHHNGTKNNITYSYCRIVEMLECRLSSQWFPNMTSVKKCSCLLLL